MDNTLEVPSIEVPSISQSFDYLSYAQTWIYEHIFEMILLLALIGLAIYKYSKDKELFLSNGFKSFMESMEEKANQWFGKLWLKSNMDGSAIRTKSVTFSDDQDDDDNSDDDENNNSLQSSYI
jgi:hypothetical protein